MTRPISRLVLAVAAALVVLAAARSSHADEIAPELEAQDLRAKAELELRRIVLALPAVDRKRLTGIYVAFQADASDPLALAACDDDGDYVVVLSDAMLRLASHVARAQSYDDANSTRKVEEYAGFVARSQIPGRRLLPPPPGFYIAESPADTYEDRLRETLSFVVARELTHLRAGQLVCPHPTPTREAGDAQWTPSEHRRALELVSAIYPGRTVHDAEAIGHVLDAGTNERGALALLRFFDQLEAEQRVVISRYAPTYRTQYPQAAARAATVRAAAEGHRESD